MKINMKTASAIFDPMGSHQLRTGALQEAGWTFVVDTSGVYASMPNQKVVFIPITSINWIEYEQEDLDAFQKEYERVREADRLGNPQAAKTVRKKN